MNNYEYIKEYMRQNCMHFGFTLNKNTDADVIEYLDTLENKRGYMLELIRKDMRRIKRKAARERREMRKAKKK